MWVRTAPWRLAPRLALRHPGVLLAVAGTCAPLAMAAASGPLFAVALAAALGTQRVLSARRTRHPAGRGRGRPGDPAAGGGLLSATRPT